MYDAEFHAFVKLSALAQRLLPGVRDYNEDQCNALHEYAGILAKDLTSGKFVYKERRIRVFKERRGG
jgi:hypothetical protein